MGDLLQVAHFPFVYCNLRPWTKRVSIGKRIPLPSRMGARPSSSSDRRDCRLWSSSWPRGSARGELAASRRTRHRLRAGWCMPGGKTS